MKLRPIVLCVFITGFAAIGAAAQLPNGVLFDEQSHFSVEEQVEHPVGLPENVLQILRKDERILGCLGKNESPDQIPDSWFVASEIHLNGGDRTDLVVTSANTCLLGANIGPFWVFRNTPGGYVLVLKISAHDLDVLNVRRKGFRDIRVTSATARKVFTTIYRFNGTQYQPRPKPPASR